MSQEILRASLKRALTGEGAHVEAKDVFDGLDWKIAGSQPEGAPHSIFQLLNHLVYWQDWVVKWLDGEKPPIPEHAAGSWPGALGPESASDWEETVRQFVEGLEHLSRQADEGELFREGELLTEGDRKTLFEMLQVIASHNSHHLGQVVVLRQMLGAWPPPGGGLTW
jgi:uncharacterized damage-inducible protein DinB